MSFELKTADATRLSPALADSITYLRLEAWPHLSGRADGTAEFLIERWRNYEGSATRQPLYHIAFFDGAMAAVAHSFARTIASRHRNITILGLASVCAEKRFRGRGFGRAVVQEAFARVRQDEFEFSLFQTTPQVVPFYVRLGAVTVSNRFYNSLAEDPTQNPFWDPVPMRYPASGCWPESEIDLLGPAY